MGYALSNDIYIGSINSPLYHFQNSEIVLNSARGVFALDVIGNELSIDQFSATIRWTEDDMFDGFITYDDKVFQTVNSEDMLVLEHEGASPELKDFLNEVPYGTPVFWYVNGNYYSKGYIKSIDRQSKNSFKLTCVSGVGLLDTSMHPGNLYQNAAIQDVLASIIGGAFSYTVSNAVKNTARVYGRLPYDTRRNNLHRLLFATGAALKRDTANNDYVIDYLSNTITDVPASRVSLQGSVQYQLPSNRAEVTEHAFFYVSTVERETLFDNTNGGAADHTLVIFNGPVYLDENTSPSDPNFDGLKTTGTLIIDEQGVNYAIVSGYGTLTGKYYVHTTQIDVLENNPDNAPIRVRRVTDNELITGLNARNVSRRVLSYFQSAKTVKAKIITNGEWCGDMLRFTDSFGETTQGFLAKAETLVTSVVGAQCTLIDGYDPSNNGNNFLHKWYIYNTGTWTVPSGVTYVRVVLVGGGQGGQGGYDGENGYGRADMATEFVPGVTYTHELIGYANANQSVASGGDPGTPGQAGKVLVIEHAVLPGETISFNIGAGGAGGANNGGIGANGTPTSVSSASIGSATSDSGVITQGYFDPFNGIVYAGAGVIGIKGGDGSKTDTIDFYGYKGGNGLKGEDAEHPSYTFKGGAGGIGHVWTDAPDGRATASGGGGGGAAYGMNGLPGEDSEYQKPYVQDGHWVLGRVQGGNGGNGASALKPINAYYGFGGDGGHGGGGGGNGGGVDSAGFDFTPSTNGYAGDGGAGGLGSEGGNGGKGVAIIYY